MSLDLDAIRRRLQAYRNAAPALLRAVEQLLGDIEPLLAEVASLTAERDRLLDEVPEPCPLDHGCDPEETCSCWCMLHDCAIDECPTFKTVEGWLAGMHYRHEGIVASLTAELDRLRDLEAKARAWREWRRDPDTSVDRWAGDNRLLAAVDALDGAPAEATP